MSDHVHAAGEHHGGHDALPTGVARIVDLPGDGGFEWDHLYLPSGLKERLVNHATVALLHRARLSAVRGAPRGLLLFVGPPGTGKSTAARGLAHAVSEALADLGSTRLVEIDPHALPSDMLGQSQRNVVRLLGRTLPEATADSAFAVVLVDEVEAFATNRAAASFDTNPADLHRATDAVLWGLDRLAEERPGLLFVATTNFPDAVDDALASRADMVVPFSVPDRELVGHIVRDCLEELAVAWPELSAVLSSPALVDDLADRCKGLDGRRIRKLTVTALAAREAVAREPARLSDEDLLSAAEELAREVSWPA